MSSNKSNNMNLMHKLMYSCEDATLMVTKSFHQKLTFAEKQRLRMHLAICKPCREFRNTNKIINSGIARLNRHAENSTTFKLSEERKKRILNEMKKRKP